MSVPEDPSARIRALLKQEAAAAADLPGIAGGLQRLCRTAARVLSAAGVAIGVVTTEDAPRLWIGSDTRSKRLDECQFTLGEGPTHDAYHQGRPALANPLEKQADRWPVFLPFAHEEGVASVFAYPMQIGMARLGTLTVYHEHPTPPDRGALTTSLRFADLARDLILDGQAGTAEGESLFDPVLHAPDLGMFSVAQGMVVIQLGVSLAEAAARIRAHAYASGRPIDDVTQDVVARRLSFEG